MRCAVRDRGIGWESAGDDWNRVETAGSDAKVRVPEFIFTDFESKIATFGYFLVLEDLQINKFYKKSAETPKIAKNAKQNARHDVVNLEGRRQRRGEKINLKSSYEKVSFWALILMDLWTPRGSKISKKTLFLLCLFDVACFSA